VPLVKFRSFLAKSVEFRERDFGEGPKPLSVFSQPDQMASALQTNSRFHSTADRTSVVGLKPVGRNGRRTGLKIQEMAVS
jgi:hypothetical protein